MKSSLLKLYKFFKLEVEHNYDNRAVIGGLAKILATWEAEARLENVPDGLIQTVASCLHDYSRLEPAGRSEALENLWQQIQREAGETLPPLPAPSPSKSERAEPEPKEGMPTPKPTGPRRPRPPLVEEAPRERQSLPERQALSAPIPEAASVALNASVTVLSGVGPKHGQTLGRLGLKTLGDMLYYFPRRYDDYSKLKPINRLWYGEEVTVIGVVQSVNARIIRGGRARFSEAVVSDGSGALRLTLWNPYVAKRMRAGMEVVLSGKVDQYLGRLVMVNPEVEPLEQENLHTNRIVPVYPLTSNITQRWLRKQMYQVVTYWAPRVRDMLPETTRQSAGLVDLSTALLQAHFPESMEKLQVARHRLAFDEIFLLQLGVLRQKRAWQDRTARVFDTPEDWLKEQASCLPFSLTGAQQHALHDVRADLASGRPMNRLLQGDVGSGKTVIAALAIAMIARPSGHSPGAQSAMMAPTSILAEQHYRNLLKMLADVGDDRRVGLDDQHANTDGHTGTDTHTSAPLRPDEIRLMIGATPEGEKNEIRAGLASGAVKVIVGTHALIEDPVTFADLQLAIVDEQHRFGVEQRAALRAKGQNPHLLVMTATPIPRSLALTVYGDLDLSVMDEMPPGRQAVETQVFFPRERERAYVKIRSETEKGHQAFIIYPLVEESENGDRDDRQAGRSAVEEYARLQKEVFPQFKLGLLHGRMKAEEKDAVMADFRDGNIHVLVSTSVVEVGMDIPNATVMLVEGANRFGLAQLHQFRGRVGRGDAKAYCVLIPENADEAENERLQAMLATNDGFVLAEKDLEQRGPGDFLGTRQAGYSELRLANLTDVRLIEKARQQAQTVFQQDPDLQQPEYQLLAVALQRFWGDGHGDIS